MQNSNLKYLLLFIFLVCWFLNGSGQVMFQNEKTECEFALRFDSVPKFYSVEKKEIYGPARDGKRLLINTGVNIGMACIKFGVLWISPESFPNWDKEDIRDRGWGNSWIHNVKSGPVRDSDGFLLNGIMHPWGGAMYYMSARGSGLRWWESFIYSGLLSTFMWEYGIEAFAEIPSTQDLIITPVFGSLLGEGFFILKGKIIANHSRVFNSRFLGRTVLVLIDPVNEITDALGYKTRNNVCVQSSFVSPVYFNNTQPVMALRVKIDF